MKKILVLSVTAAAAISMSACSRGDAQKAEADASAAMTTAQDAVGAAVGATSAATLGARDTATFVSNAAQNDLYEIEAGKLAVERSASADVKAFGKMMVDQHTTMTNEMNPLITTAGETPPVGLDERRKGFLDNLRSASAADFDKVYLDQQEAAHNEALTLMKGYADNGSDPGLKAAAAGAVPKVQTHLDRVKALKAAL